MTNSPASGSDSQAFHRLAEPVRRWIWEKGWTELRDIQERSISAVLGSEADLIVAARTAGGKTEAAFLPLISQVLESPGQGGFDLVYVGPLKALINDQFGRLQDLCERAELPVTPWHGDISAGVKARARARPRGILLITPESLEALFVLRGADIPRLFAATRAVVVDELHALLDSERGIHLRSLLTRLELACGRRIRRLGLSATLGDMGLARAYLRPDDPEAVTVLESKGAGQELKVQLRGYLAGGKDDPEGEAAEQEVARHLFARLRGGRNLVFAGSRQRVEIYADRLRTLCEEEGVPNEFLPHHASLSREHRSFVEDRLKAAGQPATAVCTSTLELGIDIGEIACVGQIGAPFSVSSLRQRLGRSGRRAGTPAVLRMYEVGPRLEADSPALDTLRLGLVRGVAMVQLLTEGWCEPPAPGALHLSTLVHQILSVIAERGGARAPAVFDVLCRRGPFRQVDTALFARVLRRLASPEVQIIEQAPDGTLLLGRQGERIVEHYSFYAAFKTAEEYRITCRERTLGTLPITQVMAPGFTLIFAGRRWRIVEVSDRDRAVEVEPDRSGRPPLWEGGGGLIHDRVVARMRDVLLDDEWPAWLDPTAQSMLDEARASFRRLGLGERRIVELGPRHWLVATWAGSVRTQSLGLALVALGFATDLEDGLIEVTGSQEASDLPAALQALSLPRAITAERVLGDGASLVVEKFHEFLDAPLLGEDACSCRVDLEAIPEISAELLAELRPAASDT